MTNRTARTKRHLSSSYSHLSESDALNIKQRIWDGEICEKIAADYEVSVSTIRSISAGIRWGLVAWPETDQKGKPLTGAIPKWRRKEIFLARREARHRDHVKTLLNRSKNPLTPEQVEESIASWKPGERRRGKATADKVTKLVDAMSADDREELLKKLLASKPGAEGPSDDDA